MTISTETPPSPRERWPSGKIPTRRWFVIQAVAYSELSEQCNLLILASDRLEKAASDGPLGTPPNVPTWVRTLWLDVNSILTAYSAVTHLLWPSPHPGRPKMEKDIATARGALLRRGLGVTSPRPTISRQARNAFEHTDERLDDWVLDQDWPEDIPPDVPRAWSVSRYPPEVEPRGYASVGFRYLNTTSFDVRIGNDHVNLLKLRAFAEKLLPKIPKALTVQWGEAEL
jgi:hypothetical protein